jgi:hypothetical protein
LTEHLPGSGETPEIITKEEISRSTKEPSQKKGKNISKRKGGKISESKERDI